MRKQQWIAVLKNIERLKKMVRSFFSRMVKGHVRLFQHSVDQKLKEMVKVKLRLETFSRQQTIEL